MELGWGYVVVDIAFNGITDGSGFFAYDNGNDIELFADSDGAAVTETEVRVDVWVGGDGKNAAGGEDRVPVYDDCSVVERGVLEEKGFKERCGDFCVDGFSGFGELIYLVLPFEYDKGSGSGLGHVDAGLDIGVKIEGRSGVDVVAPEEQPLEEAVAADLGFCA